MRQKGSYGSAPSAAPASAWWCSVDGVVLGKCSTWSTFIEVSGSPATSDDFGRRVVFAWQAQHLEHLQLVLRGRCSTWSTSVSFCVAVAALGAPKSRFAWQVQHWTHLSWVLRGISLRLKPSTQHHLHYIITYTIIKTTPSPRHHQHNLINTTSSTHHHLHNTIYKTPSTLHHQHNTIYTTSPFTLHHQHNIINTTSSTHHHLHNTIYTTPSTQHHAAPATQNELEMLQVLRVPRKTTRRPKSSLVAGLPLTSMKVLQVLHLPRKTNLRCSKCCACHAKRAGGAPSAAPATQKRRGAQSHHSSPDFRWPLWRCSKCCTCHAKRTWGAPHPWYWACFSVHPRFDLAMDQYIPK